MKTQTTHTPGPWEIWGELADVAVGQKGGRIAVAQIITTEEASDIGAANARLIAAAPELLEACKECGEWFDLIKQNYPDMPGLIRGLQNARAAIAKAEGR